MSDLNYGMQIAAFDKTALLFGPRNGLSTQVSFDSFRWEEQRSLARMVSYSGAFPGAFPATRESVRVSFGASNGRGLKRELALVDGGVIDNHGRSPLTWLAWYATEENNAAVLDLSWKSDAIVVSDGGALFAVLDHVVGLGALTRAFTVSDVYKPKGSSLPGEWFGVENIYKTLIVSAAAVQLPPKTRLAVRTQRRDSDQDTPYHVGISPYTIQPAVLLEMATLLPEAYRKKATQSVKKLNEFDIGSPYKKGLTKRS